MAILNESESMTEEQILLAASFVAEELAYGTNSRGSAAYRAEVAKVLVERCIREVLA